ncbi:MAG: sensor domain-containing diguanylate cyclase [Alphaproteobacteria bacterium]|nr:sensor domain-containing diguanylate cyclase [Alphaproteobacteria bacterium]
MFSAAALPGRGRLIVLIGGILLLGFLTTNLISFRVSTAALKATILQNELPLTSSNIYSEIQTDLLRPIFVSSLMSNDTFVKDWLIGGEQNPAQITRYLDEIRAKYDVFTAFLISDATKQYHHFSGPTKVVRVGEPNDDWFFRVREMTQPYEVNIDFNAAQGMEITIFINYRVLDYQGRFIGATGVGLKLDTVARILSHYKSNYQRGIYFVAGDGQVTVRSEGAVIQEDNIKTAPGISAIANDILSKTDGYFEYVRDSEIMLLTSRLIPDLGWRVIVEQRESEALSALWRSFVTNLAIGIGIILLTIGTIAYAINLYQKRLEDMAVTDKLTGVGNRQLFDIALDQALKLRRRVPLPLSVLLIDIDRFKSINDTRGHLRGDEVIRAVAMTLNERVREADLFARWGGEEFILLANNCRLEDATELAETLREAVASAPVLKPDDGLRVTVSCGVAECADDDDAETLIGRADRALYRAKDEGRNRVQAEYA